MHQNHYRNEFLDTWIILTKTEIKVFEIGNEKIDRRNFSAIKSICYLHNTYPFIPVCFNNTLWYNS